MIQKILSLALTAMLCSSAMAQEKFDVTVENKSNIDRTAAPVVIDLDDYDVDDDDIKSAVVTMNGTEIPSQLDDLNQDGEYDELCFLTNIAAKEKQTFNIALSKRKAEKEYDSQVYVQMMLSNKKIKEANKQDTYISSLTVENGSNPYRMLHHHGPAFENDMVAYRVYFDHRQTIDIYGKYKRGLELKQTQFYPDKEQLAAGFGDDVLWVGQTFGLGALRGWDGNAPQMLTDVKYRTMTIISRGPLRTIVKVVDEGWNIGNQIIDMTTFYTLYAGRRDCFVDVKFDRDLPGVELATGLINVKNSTEYSDNKGLRGCWGKDWPVTGKDTLVKKIETVGLGICIPKKNVVKELPANKDNYPYVVGKFDDEFHYNITFCSDNETFGYHSDKEWYAYLKAWKEELNAPVIVRKVKK